MEGQNHWIQAKLVAERLVDLLESILSLLMGKIDVMKQHEAILGKNALFYLNDLEIILGEIYETKEILYEFFIYPKDDYIYWIDYVNAAMQNGIVLFSQPIMGNKESWNRYFGTQKSVIMTSATLSVKHSFQFFETQLGIADEQIYSVSLPSPFHYEEQVKLLVPNDIPDIQTQTVVDFSETEPTILLRLYKRHMAERWYYLRHMKCCGQAIMSLKNVGFLMTIRYLVKEFLAEVK